MAVRKYVIRHESHAVYKTEKDRRAVKGEVLPIRSEDTGKWELKEIKGKDGKTHSSIVSHKPALIESKNGRA